MPPPVAASKSIRPKTVAEVFGAAFEPSNNIGMQTKIFTNKFLKWTAREYSTENTVFLLVAEDFRTQPTLGNLMQISDDFILQGAARQINLPAAVRQSLDDKITQLKAIAENGRRIPIAFRIDVAILDECVKEIRKLVKNDSSKRLLANQFDTAFVMNPAQTAEYDSAINFLRTEYQISLA